MTPPPPVVLLVHEAPVIAPPRTIRILITHRRLMLDSSCDDGCCPSIAPATVAFQSHHVH